MAIFGYLVAALGPVAREVVGERRETRRRLRMIGQLQDHVTSCGCGRTAAA